jgi:hypothetical protein
MGRALEKCAHHKGAAAMTRSIPAPSRRRFLLTAGAATAAAVVATTASRQRTPAPAQDRRATRGYHASEHVNNYYRTTKV